MVTFLANYKLCLHIVLNPKYLRSKNKKKLIIYVQLQLAMYRPVTPALK